MIEKNDNTKNKKIFDPINFGKNIKFYREKLGFDLERFSNRIKKDSEYLKMIEDGLIIPHEFCMKKISEVLSIGLKRLKFEVNDKS